MPRPSEDNLQAKRLISEALRMELLEKSGKNALPRYRMIARKLIAIAESSDKRGALQAMQIILDRLEGRAPQPVTGADGGAIVIRWEG